MGDLQTNINLLVGKNVARIHVVKSERTRQADHYLVVECDDGTRVLTPYVTSCPRPAPDSLMALREAAKENGAFTVQEALVLAEGKPLGSELNTQENVDPSSVSVDDARGLTQTEEAVDKALTQIGSALTLVELEKEKDRMTDLLEQVPQDRRGPWYEKLGTTYKETKRMLKQEG